MKAMEVMSRPVRTCFGDSSLAEAARMMWDEECGILPVVESMGGRLVGVITDRDVCMAAMMRGDAPDRIPVRQCCSRGIHSCRPEDDVEVVHEIMRNNGLHRVPVITDDEHVVGIVSIDDLAMAALREDVPQQTRDAVARTVAIVAGTHVHQPH